MLFWLFILFHRLLCAQNLNFENLRNPTSDYPISHIWLDKKWVAWKGHREKKLWKSSKNSGYWQRNKPLNPWNQNQQRQRYERINKTRNRTTFYYQIVSHSNGYKKYWASFPSYPVQVSIHKLLTSIQYSMYNILQFVNCYRHFKLNTVHFSLM